MIDRSFLRELVLIVSGILIALGIDAIVNRRTEQRLADEYLVDLALELRADSAEVVSRAEALADIAESASALLDMVRTGDPTGHAGALLVDASVGEGLVSDPVVWEELRATGSLRLIRDARVRSGIVAHYLDRATRFRIIEENFVPAVRGVRAIAWAVLPIGFTGAYLSSGQTVEPSEAVLERILAVDGTSFELQRVVATSTVARVHLLEVAASSGALLSLLEEGGS